MSAPVLLQLLVRGILAIVWCRLFLQQYTSPFISFCLFTTCSLIGGDTAKHLAERVGNLGRHRKKTLEGLTVQ